LLPIQLPGVWSQIKHALTKHNVAHDLLEGTADIWARDYMPVQTPTGKWVLFNYDPSYLRTKKYNALRTDQALLKRSLPFSTSIEESKIRLDGGNVVRWHKKGIVTDKIYTENPEIYRGELRDKIKALLELDPLIVIPNESGDFTGHADGMVRFINEYQVFVSDCRLTNPVLWEKVTKKLNVSGLTPVPFPYRPSIIKNDNGDYTAIGNYINFLQAQNLVILPQYCLAEEQSVREIINKYLDIDPIGVYAVEVAEKGGVLNCLFSTFQI
jgi:agmatine deiminase